MREDDEIDLNDPEEWLSEPFDLYEDCPDYHERFIDPVAFADERTHTYWTYVLRALEKSVAVWFLNGFEDVNQYVPRSDPEGRVLTLAELHEAVGRMMSTILINPSEVIGRANEMIEAEMRVEEEGRKVAENEKPMLIPRSAWDEMPDPLELWHVAALIQTTPKNVRNIVYRSLKPRLEKITFPMMIQKPHHRLNYAWQWSKESFLKFVTEKYGHLYD